MKKTLSLIILTFLTATLIQGCGGNKSQGFKRYKNLSEVWSQIKREGIEEISFCESITEEAKTLEVRFLVPKDCIKKSEELLDTAVKRTNARFDIWEVKFMQITTKKNTYLIPANWTSVAIYGNDWVSEDLRKYYEENGFKKAGQK
jgi:hypothetical protein